jgi:hypothetical protein
MDSLITQIMTGQFQDARASLFNQLDTIRDQSFVRMKAMIGDSLVPVTEEVKELTEADVMRRGRIKIIRRRIRKGKLQRNIKKSAVKGFTIKKGKMTRIPAAQRIRMRMKARRAAIKRRGKLQQALRKRKISLRKRKAMGIH